MIVFGKVIIFLLLLPQLISNNKVDLTIKSLKTLGQFRIQRALNARSYI